VRNILTTRNRTRKYYARPIRRSEDRKVALNRNYCRGGIERQRISSQSFKAALRDNPTLVRTKDGAIVGDTMKELARSLGLDMSVRSALIGERKLVPALVSQKLNEEDAKAWSNRCYGTMATRRCEG